MNKKNNFKQLLDLTPAPPAVKERVRSRVEGNVSFISFFFKLMDLYVPKVLEVFVGATREDPPRRHNDPASSFDAFPPNIVRPQHRDVNYRYLKHDKQEPDDED
jgi:hypothetical protein